MISSPILPSLSSLLSDIFSSEQDATQSEKPTATQNNRPPALEKRKLDALSGQSEKTLLKKKKDDPKGKTYSEPRINLSHKWAPIQTEEDIARILSETLHEITKSHSSHDSLEKSFERLGYTYTKPKNLPEKEKETAMDLWNFYRGLLQKTWKKKIKDNVEAVIITLQKKAYIAHKDKDFPVALWLLVVTQNLNQKEQPTPEQIKKIIREMLTTYLTTQLEKKSTRTTPSIEPTATLSFEMPLPLPVDTSSKRPAPTQKESLKLTIPKKPPTLLPIQKKTTTETELYEKQNKQPPALEKRKLDALSGQSEKTLLKKKKDDSKGKTYSEPRINLSHKWAPIQTEEDIARILSETLHEITKSHSSHDSLEKSFERLGYTYTKPKNLPEKEKETAMKLWNFYRHVLNNSWEKKIKDNIEAVIIALQRKAYIAHKDKDFPVALWLLVVAQNLNQEKQPAPEQIKKIIREMLTAYLTTQSEKNVTHTTPSVEPTATLSFETKNKWPPGLEKRKLDALSGESEKTLLKKKKDDSTEKEAPIEKIDSCDEEVIPEVKTLPTESQAKIFSVSDMSEATLEQTQTSPHSINIFSSNIARNTFFPQEGQRSPRQDKQNSKGQQKTNISSTEKLLTQNKKNN